MDLDKIREALTAKLVIKLDSTYLSGRLIAESWCEQIYGLFLFDWRVVTICLSTVGDSYIEVEAPHTMLPGGSLKRVIPERADVNSMVLEMLTECGYEIISLPEISLTEWE